MLICELGKVDYNKRRASLQETRSLKMNQWPVATVVVGSLQFHISLAQTKMLQSGYKTLSQQLVVDIIMKL